MRLKLIKPLSAVELKTSQKIMKLIFIFVIVIFAYANAECPPVDGPFPVHFSHESDCTKFYKCDRGVAGNFKNNFINYCKNFF